MNSSKHYFLLKRGKYSFELHGHRSSLPGVTCPSCGVWAGTGINYPLAGLADGAPRALLDDVSPVPLEEYRRRASLVVGVPEGCVLGPGSGVGPFRGSVRGTVRDINIGFFNLVLKRHAFDALREEGLGLVGAPLQLRGAKHDLVEVQVEPRARLPAICFPDGRYPAVCPTCGRISIVVPDAVVLDRASLPREKDVFRGIDASTHIFVTDRFRMACMKLGLSGMIFHPVAVA